MTPVLEQLAEKHPVLGGRGRGRGWVRSLALQFLEDRRLGASSQQETRLSTIPWVLLR